MRQPKGFIPIVVVAVIAILASTMVGVSWYYNQHKDEEVTNTEITNTTNTPTNADTDTNTSTNTSIVEYSTYPIAEDWQDYHVGGMQSDKFYKDVDGEAQIIETPFNIDEYYGMVTKYGAIFWKKGENRTASADPYGDFTYEYGVNPDFRFYNFVGENFSTLPVLELTLGEQKFERIIGVYQSSTEPKIMIEVGEYDTQSSEILPGLGGPQPVKSHGVVLDLVLGSYETGDPLTVYLSVLNASAVSNGGGSYGFHWDSKGQQAVAAGGGEGCGASNNLIFVDLKKETKEEVGGVGSFTFKGSETNPCNPKNAASPDDYWFILSGESTAGNVDVYLFNQKSTEPIKQSLGIPKLQNSEYVKSWDLSAKYPVVTLSSGQIIDFNTGQVIGVPGVTIEEVGKVKMEGEPIDITYANNYAYVANGYRGMEVYDVQDPANPKIVGTLAPSTETPGGKMAEVDNVAIKGTYAYISDTRLRIADISDPANPQVVATADNILNPWVFGTALYQDYAFVVVDGGMKGVNVADPKNPKTFNVDAIPFSASDDLTQDGSRIYVRSPHQIDIVDVSTPSAPVLLGTYTSDDWIAKSVVGKDGLHVFSGVMGDGNLQINKGTILDVSDPSNIQTISTYDSSFLSYGGHVYDLIFENNTAYVTREYGLYIYDVSDITAPKLLGVVNGSAVRQMAKNGDYVYLASSNYDTGGFFRVYKITEVN